MKGDKNVFRNKYGNRFALPCLSMTFGVLRSANFLHWLTLAFSDVKMVLLELLFQYLLYKRMLTKAVASWSNIKKVIQKKSKIHCNKNLIFRVTRGENFFNFIFS
jgi:hypothetical protein